MKHLSAGIKLGVLVLGTVVIGYLTFKSVGSEVSGPGSYQVWAKFRDAQGLPEGSRVVIAGLPVGEIAKRDLLGRHARLTLRLANSTELYDNAVIFKKQSSLLGEYYLDIDPGTPQTPDGQSHAKLADGAELTNVVEAASTDDVIRGVNEILPIVSDAVEEIKGLAQDTRKIINEPVKSMAETLDQTIKRESAAIHEILVRIDRIAMNVETVTGDVRGISEQGKLRSFMDNLVGASDDLRDVLAATKGEIQTTGSAVREKLDRIDASIAALEQTLESSASVAKKVDGDQGTLGRLVNDSTIADNLEEITDDVKGFAKTAFGMQAFVGVRVEQLAHAREARTGVSVELWTRPDKFYFIELVNDPRGTVKDVYTSNGDGTGLERTTTIEPRSLRITFQFAKVYDPFTFRIGLKESTGGMGLDLNLLDERLMLSADLFDADFDDWPRIRLMAAYNFFRYLYVYAGVDDLMNSHEQVDIAPQSLTGLDPQYVFGRDYFAGVKIRFSDADLSSLLFIGGAALAGAAAN